MSIRDLRRPEVPIYEPHEIIDQLVVDGHFDTDPPNPVSARKMGLVAVGANWKRDPRFLRSVDVLKDDPRFVSANDDGYVFRPELTEGSTVRPTWRAIIEGTARHTTQEAYLAWSTVDRYTELIHESYAKRFGAVDPSSFGIVSPHTLRHLLSDIQDRLETEGFRLTYESYGAFLAFVSLKDNNYFFKLPDGRIVFKKLFLGKVDDIEPLKPIDDLVGMVQSILKDQYMGRTLVVTPIALWVAIEESGYYVTGEQRESFVECLRRVRGTTQVESNRFIYRLPKAEARLRAKLGGAGLLEKDSNAVRKPRRRR